MLLFFFKQKTAYEMRISDWSSDVCSSDLPLGTKAANRGNIVRAEAEQRAIEADIAVTRVEIGREIDRLVAERGLIAAEIKRIDAEVLPSASRAVRLIQDGLARGGTAFTFLEFSQADRKSTRLNSRH